MKRDDRTTKLGERLLGDKSAITWVQAHVGGRPTDVEHVQSLWSGYGEIIRVLLAGADVPSVIVKWVEPPQDVKHPRGWSGRASHERKLRSYRVEQCFYSDWIPDFHTSHRTAKCHHAETTPHGWRFLLEDLDGSGFADRFESLNLAQINNCLRWLASFHAHFLNRKPTGLWETGTYWHLATRKDELKALKDPGLRDAAPKLDNALNNSRYQTLVHGDAKVANFCFGKNDVAAVDFQYVGGGCGIKDVAYFLSSCLTDAECEAQAPQHLETYFGFLRAHLSDDVDKDAVVTEWRGLYPAAWADFHRFLAGWAPDHWKIHSYTHQMSAQAIAEL
jgi:hypothetical protein